jgi:hypothetical protein
VRASARGKPCPVWRAASDREVWLYERLSDAHPAAVGLRWWSTLEAGLANITLYDRAAPGLRLVDIEPLTLEHPATREAADLLGLAIARRR